MVKWCLIYIQQKLKVKINKENVLFNVAVLWSRSRQDCLITLILLCALILLRFRRYINLLLTY